MIQTVVKLIFLATWLYILCVYIHALYLGKEAWSRGGRGQSEEKR